VVMSCRAMFYVLPLPEAPVSIMPIRCRKPPGMLTKCLGLAPGRGGRRDGQTGDEIPLAHVYRKEEE
jgi:hypothetical protein